MGHAEFHCVSIVGSMKQCNCFDQRKPYKNYRYNFGLRRHAESYIVRIVGSMNQPTCFDQKKYIWDFKRFKRLCLDKSLKQTKPSWQITFVKLHNSCGGNFYKSAIQYLKDSCCILSHIYVCPIFVCSYFAWPAGSMDQCLNTKRTFCVEYFISLHFAHPEYLNISYPDILYILVLHIIGWWCPWQNAEGLTC